MKKLLLLLLGALTTLPTLARDFQYTYEGQTITYTVIDEDTKTCMAKEGSSQSNPGNNISDALILPSNPEDGNIKYTLVKIGSFAFSDCSGLTSVTIPNSVTEIGEDSFCFCSGLTSVTIPNSVTTICGGAFLRCSSLTSVTIPNSVTTIGEYAFYGCEGLISVTIPNSVTEIGECAFYGCEGLISVIIPNSVTTIAERAFAKCSSLTSVTIPNSVTTISEEAFYDCEILISVTIPNSVTEIGESAFAYCRDLTSVTIPNSVTYIGYGAFDGCYNLTSVTYLAEEPIAFDKSIFSESRYWSATLNYLKLAEEKIQSTEPWSRFYKRQGCDADFTPTISSFAYTYEGKTLIYTIIDEEAKTVKTKDSSAGTPGNNVSGDLILPSEVYYGTTKYTLTEIGKYGFFKCSTLTSVTIPNSVTKIGAYAFCLCSGLTSVNISESVSDILPDALGECESLKAINVAAGNSNYTSVDGVLYSKDASQLIQYPGGKEEKEFIIPNSVTEIGDDAFSKCSSMTSVSIPNSVTTIGSGAFRRCSSLTSVTIPNSVTTIGANAFSGCSGLTSVTIPCSVTSIGDYAFSRCSSLTSVTYLAKEPEWFGSQIFDEEIYQKATLNYLKSAEQKIAATEPWSLFTNRIGRDANWKEEGAISEVQATDGGATAVYDMRGVKVGTSTEGLPKGIYIIRKGNKTQKFAI